MSRKAQNTLFIIIGLFIVIIFAFVLQLQKDKIEAKDPISNQDNVATVKNYVENCMNMILDDGVIILGKQGGYFHPKHSSFENSYYVSYLYYENENLVPTIEELEVQLSLYIDNQIIDCVNFSKFHNFKIEMEKPETKTIINNSSIVSSMNWKLLLNKEGEIQTLDYFNTKIESNLLQIHSIVENVILQSELGFDELDLSIFDVPNIEHNITKMFPNKIRYHLIDVTNNDKPYDFIFYEQLDINEKLNKNKPPKFTRIDDLNITVGEVFQYKFEAIDPENDQLTFDAKTVLFELLDNGELYFIAQEHLIGDYAVPIYVYDDHDNLDFSIIKVNIQP
ncbi:hypothetical protein HN415_09550 [Candidatus Woesearchaeota archaeon]|jgi:hypothetical protein|nr:hypothetical protein [Candidatus Woesearchaeota archaeon]